SNATNSFIADSQAIGTIVNDDLQPSISINDVTVTEGNSATVSAVFTVSLGTLSSQTITVNYATADDTATLADGDYQSASGTLTFAPGQTVQTITVLVNGDSKFEGDERFFVNLSAPLNATIGDGQGVGTILNDECQPPEALVSGSQTICAGASAAIQVALTGTAPWTLAWSDGFAQTNILTSPATRNVSPAVTTNYTVANVSDAGLTFRVAGLVRMLV